jgi:hypothetical protein
MTRKPGLRAVLAVCFSIAAPGHAAAHAKLKSAAPPSGAEVPPTLSEIRLEFNETLEPAFSSVELLDGAKAVIASAACAERLCVLPVKDLKAGDYWVHYRVLSADGHTIEKTYGFKVRGG